MIDSFRGDYAFLSNFYPVEVEYEGVQYPTVEHAYQAAKITDLRVRDVLSSYKLTARDVKILSHVFRIRPLWDDMKLGVMEDLLKSKFSKKSLAIQLFRTGDHELVEGNTWNDTFWGVCNGVGTNHLGQLLMKIRTALVVGSLVVEGGIEIR